MKPSNTFRTLQIVFGIILLLSMQTIVNAANNPGHDTLYIEENGITGTLNITELLTVERTLWIKSYLDILANGSTITGTVTRPTIQATNNQLDILTNGNPIYLNRYGGGAVFTGSTSSQSNMNVSGNLYINNPTSATILTVGGVNVCLANGTNCPSNSGSSSAGGWTNTTTTTTTTLITNITNTLYTNTLHITTLTASNCDVKAYTNGTLYCGTDATGSAADGTGGWTNTTTTTSTSLNVNVDSGTLYVNSTGNYVGIGTATPSYKLDVANGNFRFGSQYSPTSNYGFTFANSVTASSGAAVGISIRNDLTAAANNDLLIGVNADAITVAKGAYTGLTVDLIRLPGSNLGASGGGTITTATTLHINDAPTIGTNNFALRVDSGTSYFGGNVGIGTTTPTATLHVNGTTNTTGLTIAGFGGSSNCDVKSYPNGTLYCGTDATGSATDGNNYTTGISFAGKTLTLTRTGMSDLTATIPNNAITLDYTNITSEPWTEQTSFNTQNTSIWQAINGKGNTNFTSSSSTAGYLAQWQSTGTLNNSGIYQSGSKIGIGTTSPTSVLTIIGANATIGNPPDVLYVQGGTSANVGSGGSASAGITLNAGPGVSSDGGGTTGGTIRLTAGNGGHGYLEGSGGGNGGNIYLTAGDAGDGDTGIQGSPGSVVIQAGNGVYTTFPAGTVEILGGNTTQTYGPNGNVYLAGGTGGNSQGYVILGMTASGQGRGNIGIGMNAPASKLQVNGTTNTTNLIIGTFIGSSNCDVKSYANGTLYCGTDATGAGGDGTGGWTNTTTTTSTNLNVNITGNLTVLGNINISGSTNLQYGSVNSYIIEDLKLPPHQYNYQMKNFTLPTGFNAIEAMVFDGTYMWTATDTSPTNLIRIDPLTGNYQNMTLNSGEGNVYGLASDGTYIYVPTYTAPAKIVKVLASNMTRVSAYTLESGTDYLMEMLFDGRYVWGITNSGPSKLIKYDPLTETHTTFNLSINNGWSIASDGKYIWIGNDEGGADKILRFNPINFTVDTINTGNQFVEGIAFDGASIWAVQQLNPAVLIKVNPETLNTTQYTMNSGEDSADAIVFDGQNLWVALKGGSTAAILKVDPKDPYGHERIELENTSRSINALGFDGTNIWAGTYTSPARIYKIPKGEGMASTEKGALFDRNPETNAPTLLIQPRGTTSWSTGRKTLLGISGSATFNGSLVDVQSNGASKFYINSTGYIGINTTTPSQPLTLNGNMNITDGCIYTPGGGRLCGNTSCTTLYSPNGLTKVEACN